MSKFIKAATLILLCIEPTSSSEEALEDFPAEDTCDGTDVSLLQTSLGVHSRQKSKSKEHVAERPSVAASGGIGILHSAWRYAETDVSTRSFGFPEKLDATVPARTRVLVEFLRYVKPILLKTHWLIAAPGALVASTCLNLDDAFWLMPFVVGRRRPRRHGLLYIGTMQLLAVVAWYMSGRMIQLPKGVTPLKLASSLAAVYTHAWGFYALVLLYAWLADRAQRAAPVDDALCIKPQSLPPVGMPAAAKEVALLPMAEENTNVPQFSIGGEDSDSGFEGNPTKSRWEWLKQLGTGMGVDRASMKLGSVQHTAGVAREEIVLSQFLAFLAIGCMNNFAMFLSLLEYGILTGPQLVFAVQASSCVVAAACCGAGSLRSVANTVEGVPLWCIAGSLGVWTLVGARS